MSSSRSAVGYRPPNTGKGGPERDPNNKNRIRRDAIPMKHGRRGNPRANTFWTAYRKEQGELPVEERDATLRRPTEAQAWKNIPASARAVLAPATNVRADDEQTAAQIEVGARAIDAENLKRLKAIKSTHYWAVTGMTGLTLSMNRLIEEGIPTTARRAPWRALLSSIVNMLRGDLDIEFSIRTS